MPYLSGIYLRVEFGWNLLMVFLVMVRVEHKKRKNTDRRKTLKNQENKKRRIQEKPNNNNEHLQFYLSYKELYFSRKQSLKKCRLYQCILFTVFMRYRIFEKQ